MKPLRETWWRTDAGKVTVVHMLRPFCTEFTGPKGPRVYETLCGKRVTMRQKHGPWWEKRPTKTCGRCETLRDTTGEKR